MPTPSISADNPASTPASPAERIAATLCGLLPPGAELAVCWRDWALGNDSGATRVGTAVRVVVLGNDYDPEGKPLQVKTVGVPARGKAVLNSDGSITYTPNGKFKGSDSFSYSISDGKLSASATVYISLQSCGSDSTGTGGKGKNSR